MYKKFALVGTSCVGKSTLLIALEKKLQKQFPSKNIAIVPEAARSYFSKHKTNTPFGFSPQSEIQSLAKRTEESVQKDNPDIILCDRSVIDSPAYVSTVGDTKGAQRLLNNIIDWLPTYSHIFLLDPKDVPYITGQMGSGKSFVTRAFPSLG